MNLDESFNHHCQVVPIESHGWREEFNTCKRDHSRFIPVPEFKSTFLHPFNETYTDIQKKCIELIIDSTVKISVSRTSNKRPKTYPRCKAPYPCADLKGGFSVRYGTGYMPFHKIDRIDDKPCPCPACRRSANGNKTHWIVRVSTATHVLFDQGEAESALVELFFDSEAGGKVRQIYGIGVSPDWDETQCLDTDYCVILCVTHEPDLVDILNEILVKKEWLMGKRPPTGIMISHPHGGPKMVSLGPVDQKCYIPEPDSLLLSLVKEKAEFNFSCAGLDGDDEGACSDFPMKDEFVTVKMADEGIVPRLDRFRFATRMMMNRLLSEEVMVVKSLPSFFSDRLQLLEMINKESTNFIKNKLKDVVASHMIGVSCERSLTTIEIMRNLDIVPCERIVSCIDDWILDMRKELDRFRVPDHAFLLSEVTRNNLVLKLNRLIQTILSDTATFFLQDRYFFLLPGGKLCQFNSKPLINLKRHFFGKCFWGTISAPYTLFSFDEDTKQVKKTEVTDKEIVFFVPDKIKIEMSVRFECFSCFSYNLPACPGSSGARVFPEFCPAECDTENLYVHNHHFGDCGVFCISGRVKEGEKNLHDIKDKRIKIM